MTEGEQLDEIVSRALELGCRLVSRDERAGALELLAPDVQAKVNLLQAIAEVCASDAYVASVALALRAAWPLDDEFALGLPRWVASTIRWIDEPGERFQLAGQTLRSLVGDCDCSAIVVTSLFLAVGMESEVRGYVDERGMGIHAASAVKVAGTWRGAEATSTSARLGDDPAVLLMKGSVR